VLHKGTPENYINIISLAFVSFVENRNRTKAVWKQKNHYKAMSDKLKCNEYYQHNIKNVA